MHPLARIAPFALAGLALFAIACGAFYHAGRSAVSSRSQNVAPHWAGSREINA
jgi:hypothetical protein